MIERKEFVPVVLFHLLTCGLYRLFFMVSITASVNRMTGPEPRRMNPGMTALLTVMTCGLYHYYWLYRIALRMDRLCEVSGIEHEDTAAGLLVWSLCGLLTMGITTWIALYKFLKEYNRLVDEYLAQAVMPTSFF